MVPRATRPAKQAVPLPTASQRQKKKTVVFEDDILASPPTVIPSKSLIDRIENEISEETGVFSSKKGATKVTVTLDDDLFGSTKVDSGTARSGDFDDLFSEPPQKPRQPPPKAAKPQAPPADDLFAAPPTKPKTTPTKAKATPTKDDFLTSDVQPPRTETKPKVEADIFDNPPDDIFATAKVTKVAKVDKDDIFGSSTSDIFSAGGRKSKGLDDLFAAEVPKAKPSAKKEEGGREEPRREEVGRQGREEVDAPQPTTDKVRLSVLP